VRYSLLPAALTAPRGVLLFASAARPIRADIQADPTRRGIFPVVFITVFPGPALYNSGFVSSVTEMSAKTAHKPAE